MENQTGKIALALAKAQKAFKTVPKNRVAKVPTKAGGQYSYKYADLADVIDAVRDALSANELAFTQGVEGDNLVTVLVHSSGERLYNSVPMVSPGAMTGPQAVGSSLTYSRRYGLTALLGVVAEEDDDGQVAINMKPPKSTEKAKPSAAPTGSAPTEAQLRRLYAISNSSGWSKEMVVNYMLQHFNKQSSKELTWTEYELLCQQIERNPVVFDADQVEQLAADAMDSREGM